MKKYLLFISVFCAFSSLANAQNDVYYIPSKRVNEVTTLEKRSNIETEDNVNNYASARDIDEYNRRSSSVSTNETNNSEEFSEETEDYDNYNCAKKILRFHSPVVGVVVSSPYYWDICYGNTWDVYYDEWAYGLPSWSFYSYAYDPWHYNRWWYRSCWDYTWGWYDPWWGASYWGWNRPLYWGWDRPCYGGWGSAHHGPGGSWGGHYAPGFDRVPGGGRQFASNTNTITRGSAGGFIRQGGNNYRSMQTASTNSRSYSSNHGTLSKSFRVDGSDNRSSNGTRVSGGGYTRSNGSTYSRSTTSRNYTPSSSQRGYTTNRTVTSSSTPSRTTTTQRTSPTISPSMGSSSSRGGGGMVSSGGGSSRSGGGGFSRGGGGGRR